MAENKRIFLTGALIAALLLLTPFYLQLIGVSTEEPEQSSVAVEEIVSGENSKITKNNQPTPPLPSSSYVLSEKHQDADALFFTIKTEKLNLQLSTHGGGSIKTATLHSDGPGGYKYLGGYDDNDVFHDSIHVSLILNQTNCSPCLSFSDNNEEFFVDVPFGVVSPTMYNMEVFDLNALNKDSLEIQMSATVHGMKINKTTTFYKEGYQIKHFFEVFPGNNQSFSSPTAFVSWYGGIRNTEKDRYFENSQYTQGYLAQDKNIESFSYSPQNISDQNEKKTFNGKTDWAAIRNKYFINTLISSSASGGFLGGKPHETLSGYLMPEYSMGLNFGRSNSMELTQFLGPLDVDALSKTNTYLDRVMNFGWLPIQPFSRAVLWLLKFLHGFGLNYGVILVLFAVLIRIITGPLTKKSHESSQNMQKIQPQIKKIQTKFKKDSKKMNQEIMKLYTKSGVNPLGGCLPMLIQMPLLFSLFIVFRSTIEFRGAPFVFWIDNLSQPDTIFYLPFSIPIYGAQVAVLPVFLGISMFLSQRLSMATMDSKQKPMMYMMSVFFFLLFNSFPSGLNLYYMVYNLLNYQQQRSMRKV